MTFIDWFAGVGGFRRGMELAGHKCVGFCEFDKYAVISYTAMHLITEEQRKYLLTLDEKTRQKEILKDEYRNGEWYGPDVTRVHAGDIPRADCWCFGFPCQDISIAGHCRGFEGNRSSLFFRIIGLLQQLKEEARPRWLFIENVANLLSVHGGWDFGRVLTALDEVGYIVSWQSLNSKDFFVPQNRERIFLVCRLGEGCGPEVFPFPGDGREAGLEGFDFRQVGSGRIEQIGMLSTDNRDNKNQYRVYDDEGISPCLNTMEGGGRQPCVIANKPDSKGEFHQSYSVYDGDGLSPTLSAEHGGSVKPYVIADAPFSSQLYKVYDKDSVAPTLDTCGGGGRQPLIDDEQVCLRKERTEYGKEVRKAYENHEIDEKRGNMTAYAERTDGLCNTLTTVQKDNYTGVRACITPDRIEKRQNGRRFKDEGEPMFTLTAQDRHGVMISDESDS